MSLPSHIEKAIYEYIPTLGDWITVERACEMAQLVIDIKPQIVVEIGSFKGQSLINFGFALRENNDGGRVYGIDPWKAQYAVEGANDPRNDDWWKKAINLEEIHRNCMNAIWDHNLDPWIIVIRAASQHAYRLFSNIDILFVDGNHSECASCRDVELYVPRVKSGGTIIMDDCDWPTTQRAISMIDGYGPRVKDESHYKWWKKN